MNILVFSAKLSFLIINNMYKGKKEDPYVIPVDDDDEDIDSILQESDKRGQPSITMYPSLGSSDPNQGEQDEE